MKQYFSFLATLILCVSASSLKAQIVNIPDPVFKGYLINNTTADTNLDYEIQVSEAQNYTGTININFSSVTDLTGLEEFINLSRLYCELTTLTSLDISANVMLTHLECGANAFTSLDVSNNVNLTHLKCTQLKITDLDLSNNINLVTVDARQDSLLTTINIKNGNNIAITTTNFFVNDNPMLQCIEVDSVAYSIANWTNVDSGLVFSTSCFTNIATTENIPNLQVYPNPTQNSLTVDLGATHTSVNINISNTIGQRVQSATYNNTQIIDLNLEGLPGWYFIQIKTEKGNQTIKVLKQ